MNAEEWTLKMETCVGTIGLVNTLILDFVYSLPSNYSYCEEGEEPEWAEKMQEKTQLIMLRLDLVNQTLPKLIEALQSFSNLMAEPVGEMG